MPFTKLPDVVQKYSTCKVLCHVQLRQSSVLSADKRCHDVARDYSREYWWLIECSRSPARRMMSTEGEVDCATHSPKRRKTSIDGKVYFDEETGVAYAWLSDIGLPSSFADKTDVKFVELKYHLDPIVFQKAHELYEFVEEHLHNDGNRRKRNGVANCFDDLLSGGKNTTGLWGTPQGPSRDASTCVLAPKDDTRDIRESAAVRIFVQFSVRIGRFLVGRQRTKSQWPKWDEVVTRASSDLLSLKY